MKQKAETKSPKVVINFAAAKAKMWGIDKIKPYEGNPRAHSEKQVQLLATMMTKYGVDQPIVVDEGGVILKGHGRRLAALAAGFPAFPVVQHFGLSDSDKRAMRIADNQVALLSGWDDELLKIEVDKLHAGNFDLGILGFSERQLEGIAGFGMAPADFAAFGEDIETEHECPKCGYRWSGKSAPPKEEEGEAA